MRKKKEKNEVIYEEPDVKIDTDIPLSDNQAYAWSCQHAEEEELIQGYRTVELIRKCIPVPVILVAPCISSEVAFQYCERCTCAKRIAPMDPAKR